MHLVTHSADSADSKPPNMKEKIKNLMLEAMTASPGRLSEIAIECTAWYAKYAEELEDILIFKTDRWLELRKDQKSDRSTDRMWDATEEGKQEIRLRSVVKTLEKFVSSIKLRLRIKEGESYGKY